MSALFFVYLACGSGTPLCQIYHDKVPSSWTCQQEQQLLRKMIGAHDPLLRDKDVMGGWCVYEPDIPSYHIDINLTDEVHK
jgi:hypothetical protein